MLEILQAVKDRLATIDKNTLDETLNLTIGKSVPDYSNYANDIDLKVQDIYERYRDK